MTKILLFVLDVWFSYRLEKLAFKRLTLLLEKEQFLFFLQKVIPTSKNNPPE
jgi:hypothetical protein